MTFWQRSIGLAWATLCATALAVQAQGLPPAAPEPIEVPPLPVHDEDFLTLPEEGEAMGSGSSLETIPTEDNFAEEAYELWDQAPVAIESSGTWLRRGFWYAKAEAVVLNYTWNRDDLVIMTEGAQLPPFDFTDRTMILRGSHPGYDAGVRFTLGRFLFRDDRNRDHSAEFVAYGGGDWVQEVTIASIQPSNLSIPFYLNVNNVAFDGASESQAGYSSRFSSFEGNYTVRNRLGRDQMVMDPNGHWVRRAWPSITRDFLVGLRFFDLTEMLDWKAQEIINPPLGIVDQDGSYTIRTDNNMFGFQMGGGFNYETSRWNAGAHGKMGVMLNDAKGRQAFSITESEEDDFYIQSRENQLSWLAEVGVGVQYHIRPDLSINAGYELLYLTSVALAPHQITFRPDDATLSSNGDAFFNGFSFGIEGFW